MIDFTPLILGIIEGFTEFLPISSTGHLLIAEHFLPRQSDFFNIVIQGAASLAMIFVFWKKIFSLTKEEIKHLLTAFLVTAIGGIILKKLRLKLPTQLTPVILATFIGGVLFLIIEKIIKNKKLETQMNLKIAFFIGLAQLLAAIFPGASRSGTTILMALVFGINRKNATEFSFLLSIPTLLSASLLETLIEIKKNGIQTTELLPTLIGSVSALLVAIISVKWLLRYVSNHNFTVFGWYRIILSLILVLI